MYNYHARDNEFVIGLKCVLNHVLNCSSKVSFFRTIMLWNIPLLDVIKQVPSYAKFLKYLCTVKRKLNVKKKAFLAEQVSVILQKNNALKYKEPGCPTISCFIG